MSTEKRRSLLQLKILLQLSKEPARSVTSLAEALASHRPSVSRSLRSLQTEGLVQRDRKGWHLTEVGKSEAAGVSDRLIRTVEEAASTAERVFKSLPQLAMPTAATEAAKALAAFQANLARKMLPPDFGAAPLKNSKAVEDLRMTGETWKLLGSATVQTADLMKPMWPDIESASKRISEIAFGPVAASLDAMKADAVKRLDFKIFDTTVQDRFGVSAAIAATLDTQRLQLAWMDAIPKSAFLDIQRLIGENLVGTSRLAADLTAISTAGGLGERLAEQWKAPLAQAVASIAQAHHDQMRTALAWLGNAVVSEQTSRVALGHLAVREVALPTYSVSRFVGGARDLIVPGQPWDEEVYQADVTAAQRRATSLEDSLARLAPRFLNMWRRAWEHLETGDPSAVRDIAHSARELLRQVLTTLAPDSCFPGETKITREMRITWIINGRSSSARDWSKAVAKGLSTTYDLLSGDAHSERDDPRFGKQAMIGLLEALGGLLRFLLDFTEHDDSDDGWLPDRPV